MGKFDELIKKIDNSDAKKYIEYLIKADQTDLINHDGLNKENIFDIIKQIKEFEKEYPGGLIKYVEKAKNLFKQLQNEADQYANYIIEHPNNIVKIKFHLKDLLFQDNASNKLLGIYSSQKCELSNYEKNLKEFELPHFNNNGHVIDIKNKSKYLDKNVTLPINLSLLENNNISDTICENKWILNNTFDFNRDNFKKGKKHYKELKEICPPKCKTKYENNEIERDNIELNISSIENFLYYEKIGLEYIDKVCFILLAGGLGERLNYNDIKLKLLTSVISEKSYIEYYCNYLKSFQDFIKKNKNKEMDIPFIIMLSDDTYESTINFLEDNNYFSLKKKQIYLLKQRNVLCFKNNKSHLDYIYKNNTFYLSKKPHGHGDIHTLIKKHIQLDDFIQKGYNYLYFFQDTNALAIKVLFACLGVSIEKQLHINFLAISRKPGEEIGTICKLTNCGKTIDVVNIEYNIFESILKNISKKDVVDEDGCSLYSGNTNSLIFEIRKYNEILKKTNGIVPEYVNPKYSDDTKQHFVSPVRIECMMQDFVYLYFSQNSSQTEGKEEKHEKNKNDQKNKNECDNSNKVGVTELNRFLCFSAVKNNRINAKKKIQNNIHPECIYSAEADLYYSNCAFIELACIYNKKNNNLEKIGIQFLNGTPYIMPPKVLIEPQFAFTLTQLISKIKGNITIKNNSTLWIKSDAIITNLYLDGALIIENTNKEPNNSPIILEENLYIKNQGFQIVEHLEKSKNISENSDIRDYKLVKRAVLVISS
ncbi:UTP--glucose-1-phosphate uridylyltransferase, putative [Plasmodium berghei]|uniref:UTP-monosaccharide-1-phosphate uridylyltransferase n=2 Tax=Plasmodium berghei TaxID=5821 RepID=A0A509AP27_PLABA|nr:UTP--glucose-1-phosphate uridylyltransferase, putative [Plasmodium berghei ANKA]CXI80680.1 UTP--glucose-1-phosphate uridylyltransferase, putative [Plasmodium berghei]SCM25438.1 UTP--glucose-1-phosphate uridylyltransferase, putative [Plasmodium berghei]SCN27367.1 UTP--glucose-1-phosphate uridylyltransferase, putative [Plasmodium berghei]SCO62021.1 UTP--glucose-1-phosphate uridylyltransferase, putative [Plasmodium berghei]SCO63793.1 UTP--glucose-1-phosphate uridylyltransferase, putative [Plas|eukprot:XP_034423000.1 UTP--glucose-1-phosphate uridylyltransferase, putative [Plasmodium berghei ANKA]